ncbi:hypothetical protein [Nannocystis pusilla]|uniref:hypothetical protein n=1 Tax=Nannocystis pusilla TaxID=889268 RepID=UPI003B824A2C
MRAPEPGVCAGGDADYCAAVDAWLATRLVDPATKEPLVGEARDQMCGAIYDNVEMFYAYQFKAKQKLLGEPDFILASQKKAQEEAEAYEEASKKINEEPGSRPAARTCPIEQGLRGRLDRTGPNGQGRRSPLRDAGCLMGQVARSRRTRARGGEVDDLSDGTGREAAGREAAATRGGLADRTAGEVAQDASARRRDSKPV